jgi:hypothetical protein
MLEAIALWGRKTGSELGKVVSKEEAMALNTEQNN